MALLLGSDYTEGVSGIGIVNAMEVVNAFPKEDGLHKFQDWIESPDPTILGDGEIGSSAKKRGSKFGDKDINAKSEKSEHKLAYSPTFPSEAVTSAYICPQVDKSTEPFTW